MINFYPNPTGNVLTIESNAAFNKIKVYDILGKLVETAQFQDSKSYLLDVKNYLNGIYFIQVNNNPLERIRAARRLLYMLLFNSDILLQPSSKTLGSV